MSSKPIPTKIEIIGQDQAANVASEFHVMHTPNEFMLTVIEIIPQMEFTAKSTVNSEGQTKSFARLQTKGILQRVVGRFGMSPATFKKLVVVANQNLKQFERKFGEIAINPPEGLQ